MTLPIAIAEKLFLLQQGEKIPSSRMKHPVIEMMLDNGILERQIIGRSRKLIFLRSPDRLNDYLHNHLGINNLQDYISVYYRQDASRSDYIAVSSDSKLRKVRTFKGFLVNSYFPVRGTLNHDPITIHPMAGSFQFIYDFENFSVAEEVTVVGIENPENFRHIYKQKHLFGGITPLFVCRYPQNQNKDLIRWLQSIPNPYLHFGDFDFAGIAIYLNEYKKRLGNRATFFVPDNIGDLLLKFGNKEIYDHQISHLDTTISDEAKLNRLIAMLNQCKKGLEQEIFIKTVPP
jgi:hypothetical protein